MIYALYILAAVNAAWLGWDGLKPLLKPKRARRPAGRRAARGRADQTNYPAIVRTLLIVLATFGAMLTLSDVTVFWLAAIGAILQISDNLPAFAKNEPSALAPLGLGALQIVLLAIVLVTAQGA